MKISRVDDIDWWFGATLVQKIGLVLKVICDDFVSVVVGDVKEISGFVRDEFFREKVGIGVVVGGIDAVSWIDREYGCRCGSEDG